jgi:hypothetical protein
MSRLRHDHQSGYRPGPSMIDIEELKTLGAARIASIAADCLPNGREVAGYWRSGSVADEAGQSLAVTLRGEDQGMWCDHSCTGLPEGGGNVLQLIAWTKFGGDIKPAIAWLKSFLGLDGLDPGRLATVRAQARERMEASAEDEAKQREKRRRDAVGLYLSGVPIIDTPAEFYFRTRGVNWRELGHAPGCLRYRADVWNVEAHRALPCMLAQVVDVEGRHLATHRTWLAPDGRGGWGKADLEQPKMALGSFAGGFIPLWRSDADRRAKRSMANILPGTDVWTAEGTEDGGSAAMAKPQERIVAAVTLGNIGKLRLPEQMGRLMLIGQRDTHPKTLAALERAIADQQEAGREVWLTPPPAGFKDVNDALRGSDLERGRAA